MSLAIGIDATHDNSAFTGHAGHRCTLSARTGWVSALRSGATDKTVMDASCAGAIRSCHPAAHADATPAEVHQSGQDSGIASVGGGSHPQRAVPPTFHLTVGGMARQLPTAQRQGEPGGSRRGVRPGYMWYLADWRFRASPARTALPRRAQVSGNRYHTQPVDLRAMVVVSSCAD